MAFTEDLSQFFATGDFAVAGTIKTAAGATVRSANVIFTNALGSVITFDQAVKAGVQHLLIQTADLAGVVVNEYKLTIGAVTYRITDRTDDGTGVSALQIRV